MDEVARLSVSDLRRAAARAKDLRAARRMLALAQVLEGKNRTEPAESCGMYRQTLRHWIHGYNAEGPAGLVNWPLPGRRSRLSTEQMRELTTIVETGPDPATDGVVRWRRIDLCAVVERVRRAAGGTVHGRDPAQAGFCPAARAPPPPA